MLILVDTSHALATFIKISKNKFWYPAFSLLAYSIDSIIALTNHLNIFHCLVFLCLLCAFHLAVYINI